MSDDKTYEYFMEQHMNAIQRMCEMHEAERQRDAAIVAPDTFDTQTRSMMASYAGSDFDKPREITLEALSEYADESWTLSEFRALIDKATVDIPDSAIEDAKVELDSGYSGDNCQLKITYRRMETAEEVSERVRRAYIHARKTMNAERETWERLKQKYG